MSTPGKKKHVGRNILIGVVVFLALVAIAFHIFITRYLPPMVKKRLSEIIVKGSDSLYKFEMGKFDLSFWGGSADISDLHITIDSAVYKRMSDAKTLPPMTSELHLPSGHINGIGIRALIFSKKLSIREIVFDSAEVHLARHFRNSEEPAPSESQPLWKRIRPSLKSIRIGNVYCDGLRISYKNVDSAAAFRWQIDKSNILISDIRVDSISTMDSTRMMFAKDISFNASDVNLKTTDGLYSMQASAVAYASSSATLDVKQFAFAPAVSNQDFIRHFGYEHELYRLQIPLMKFTNLQLLKWISHNRLQADIVDLSSPNISIYMDRNPPPNPNSKKGGYPHQLLQRAKFLIQINRLKATNASVTYTETNDVTAMTGKVSFPSVSGTIDNITNDPAIIKRNPECIAHVEGTIMQTGHLNTVFRFALADRSGGFNVKATVTNLQAAQLKTLFKAMTAVDMQSFNLQRLDVTINGNENASTASVSMRYTDMDILINKVGEDKSLDKKGFLSFLANRLIIYKENPMSGEEERKAESVPMQREATRSFFNLIWKNMFTAAGEIVLRPIAQRKMERKKERAVRKEERQERREQRRAERKK